MDYMFRKYEKIRQAKSVKFSSMSNRSYKLLAREGTVQCTVFCLNARVPTAGRTSLRKLRLSRAEGKFYAHSFLTD
jgi:hypothetical protein